MNAEVVFTDDFRSDLLAQTRHLLAEDKRDQAERLVNEIEVAATLLSQSPGAGPVEDGRGGRAIRRLLFRKLPFVAWYHWEEPAKRVVMLRLFHVRQRRR
jgi:plasmid stabilization system protein ParE